MSSRRFFISFLLVWLIATALPAAAGSGSDGFQAGKAYLESLPDGTRVGLKGPDGAVLDLRLADGELTLVGEAAVEDDALVTAGGYRLTVGRGRRQLRNTMIVQSPEGAATWFHFVPTHIVATEKDHGVWVVPGEALRAYLGDGTRIDFERTRNIMQIHTAGGVWRMVPSGFVTGEESSPIEYALEPTTVYQTGDGDDWIEIDDRAAPSFWGGEAGGVSVEAVLAFYGTEQRRAWIDEALGKRLDATSESEAAALLLAGYFSLPPGSSVRIEARKRQATETYLLPGTLEIPRVRVMSSDGLPRLGSP